MSELYLLTKPLYNAKLPFDTVTMARYLIGKVLVRSGLDDSLPNARASARIVETEAYPPGDEAAHHYRRLTNRNRSLFMPHGKAYVYRAYGICWMLNVSSEIEGVGAGVLIRAAIPEGGLAMMARERGGAPLRDIARGPGRLAQALRIDRSFDGSDLCADGPLFLADDGREPGPIGVGTRIGITRATERKLRFFAKENRFVSGPAWLNRLG